MTSKAAIQLALQFSDQFAGALGDMKDAPFTRPGEWGGNHPMWIAGHLAVVEGRMHKMLFGTPNPLEHWKPLFDWGTTPTDDASAYPPFEKVLGEFAALRAKTRTYLETLDDAALDQPVAVEAPGLAIFESIGATIAIIAFHQCLHAGEAAVARRAAGKIPVLHTVGRTARFLITTRSRRVCSLSSRRLQTPRRCFHAFSWSSNGLPPAAPAL